ncbi:DUF4249 domain-containing protein [Parabacteroides sp. PF5-6]|uniref:DUF4249 domain-containing protein n=1 Tax=Parabacteroides sp. PF5-6 TaxID=1742403 RepID=UPI0024053CA8|nr:DUF4249 domain-containing protein [Parabacteroides sp. PF5-6]MDF9828686.1 hypothetical protein [Parabacteroides sp. PF5-6]
MKKKLIYWIVFLAIAISCISPYEPQGIESTEGLLVVEATLLAPYGTEVKLSRTISLNDMTYEPVSGEVKILSDDGVAYRLTETEKGTYTLEQEFVYRENVKYALDMILDGKHYRSEYVEPLRTPEVDALTWKYNEKYEQVDIMVTVSNPDVDVAYYQWKFKENWEVRAPNFGTHRWDPDARRVITNELDTPNNRYYCWAKDSSRHFILGSSEKFISTTIKDKVINEIAYGGSRLSNLYHISVKQYELDGEAYSYFRNLQNNVETTGSIFAPQPTEMKGNINNLDNPKETVIGFFVATTEITIEMYIEANEVPEMQVRGSDCLEVLKDFKGPQDAYDQGYGILTYGIGAPPEYMLMRCVDCTRRGGTKKKPEWWPNDHQ